MSKSKFQGLMVLERLFMMRGGQSRSGKSEIQLFVAGKSGFRSVKVSFSITMNILISLSAV